MLWIISVKSTVLPTPAPPKSPAFPPRSSGTSTSMTLIPVSKISDFVERRATGGGSRCTEAPLNIGWSRLAVDRITEHVEHSRENSLADGHHQRPSRVVDRPCLERDPAWGVTRDPSIPQILRVKLTKLILRLQFFPLLACNNEVDRGQLCFEPKHRRRFAANRDDHPGIRCLVILLYLPISMGTD